MIAQVYVDTDNLNIDKPIDFVAITKCKESHCYNGHMLLTLGLIPNFTNVRYGDIRQHKYWGSIQFDKLVIVNGEIL